MTDGKKRVTLDPDFMILQTKALQEVARPQHDDEYDEGKFHLHPIALKAWQVREREGGTPDRLHDLVELFDRLSPAARQRLEERLPPRPDTFFGGGMRQVLEFHRKTFEDWRYPYEHDALQTRPDQLGEAVEAIIETYDPPPRIRVPLGNMARSPEFIRALRDGGIITGDQNSGA